jgi:peptide/nickel transport system permease protein
MSFVIIQLPPGDYVDSFIRNLQLQGGIVNEAQKADLEAQYGLDKSLPEQYMIWIGNIILRGDFGNSFRYQQPVEQILAERVPRTIAISLASILLTWVIAVPLGIISALKQYSIWDYLVAFVSFVGLSVPAFLLALVLMFFVYSQTGWFVTGLFSPEYRTATWSIDKVIDLLKNIWLPLIVLPIVSTGGIIRVLRASLLDELRKQYVTTARAKGLPERLLILRYPVRIAVNPLISTIGWMLPAVVGGEVVVAKVLNLPTTGPVLLEAIQSQDMYLAGALVMILSTLTIIGTLISDILLAVFDPRIRYN